MRLFKIILASMLMISVNVEARRVAERTVNIEDVDVIYMAPGLATSLEFPEAVSEVITGAPQIFKSAISSVEPNEVILTLTSQKPFQTNLIVRTVKHTFVFDLKPSLSKHQDLVKIKGMTGDLRDEREVSFHEYRMRGEKGLELKSLIVKEGDTK